MQNIYLRPTASPIMSAKDRKSIRFRRGMDSSWEKGRKPSLQMMRTVFICPAVTIAAGRGWGQWQNSSDREREAWMSLQLERQVYGFRSRLREIDIAWHPVNLHPLPPVLQPDHTVVCLSRIVPTTLAIMQSPVLIWACKKLSQAKTVFSKFGTKDSWGNFCRLVETMAVECQAVLREQMGSYKEPSEDGPSSRPALLLYVKSWCSISGRHSTMQIKIAIW